MLNKVLKFDEYFTWRDSIFNIDEAVTTDSNDESIKANMLTYNKYKTKIIAMFSDKTKDATIISTDFDKFINNLPEPEKGASDLLRSLFQSEKIKLDISTLETKKKDIESQLNQRMTELKEIMARIA